MGRSSRDAATESPCLVDRMEGDGALGGLFATKSI